MLDTSSVWHAMHTLPLSIYQLDLLLMAVLPAACFCVRAASSCLAESVQHCNVVRDERHVGLKWHVGRQEL